MSTDCQTSDHCLWHNACMWMAWRYKNTAWEGLDTKCCWMQISKEHVSSCCLTVRTQTISWWGIKPWSKTSNHTLTAWITTNRLQLLGKNIVSGNNFILRSQACLLLKFLVCRAIAQDKNHWSRPTLTESLSLWRLPPSGFELVSKTCHTYFHINILTTQGTHTHTR